jgi:hypothetical protein
VVVILSGNGLKTPDARRFGVTDQPGGLGRPGLAPQIRPSFTAVEAWLEGQA